MQTALKPDSSATDDAGVITFIAGVLTRTLWSSVCKARRSGLAFARSLVR